MHIVTNGKTSPDMKLISSPSDHKTQAVASVAFWQRKLLPSLDGSLNS